MKLLLVLIFWKLALSAVVFNYRKQIFRSSWVEDLASWWLDFGIGFRDFWLGIIRVEEMFQFGNARRETLEAYRGGSSFAFITFFGAMFGIGLGLFFSIMWALT